MKECNSLNELTLTQSAVVYCISLYPTRFNTMMNKKFQSTFFNKAGNKFLKKGIDV
jgi:hypothetical protein